MSYWPLTTRCPLLFLPLLALLSGSPLHAQAEPQQPGFFRDPATGGFTLSFSGVPGRVYFIEQSFDLLLPWSHLPVIEQGAGAPLSYALLPEPPPERFFLRLRYTDQPHGGDPYAFDFAGGGIPAGWALEHGLGPFDPAAAGQTAPGSGGLTWLQLYQQSQGPGANPAANAAGLLVFIP